MLLFGPEFTQVYACQQSLVKHDLGLEGRFVSEQDVQERERGCPRSDKTTPDPPARFRALAPGSDLSCVSPFWLIPFTRLCCLGGFPKV
jgi:hypothetical protein